MASPTIDNQLGLMTTRLTHSGLVRWSLVTYAVDNSGSGFNASQLAESCQQIFQTEWEDQLDTSVTIGPTECRLGDGTTVPSLGTSISVPGPGTRASASPPPNCNMLIKKITGLGGKQNRGRVYLPWSIDDANLDETGRLTAGEVSGAQTRADAWLAALDSLDHGMVIANKTLDSGGAVTAITMGNAVIQLTVDAIIGSQRRRIGR